MKTEKTNLCDLNIEIIYYFASILGIEPKFIKASDLDVNGSKTDLIFDICNKLDAEIYVAGPSGRDYLNLDDFSNAGIRVVFNDFEHPTYTQKNKEVFTPYMSTLDLLMNESVSSAREIVCGKRFWNDK